MCSRRCTMAGERIFTHFSLLNQLHNQPQGIDCQLAIETSGHAAFKENQMLDDGAYLALKVCLKNLIASLVQVP